MGLRDTPGQTNTRKRRKQATRSRGGEGEVRRWMQFLPGAVLSLGMPSGQLGWRDTYMTGAA